MRIYICFLRRYVLQCILCVPNYILVLIGRSWITYLKNSNIFEPMPTERLIGAMTIKQSRHTRINVEPQFAELL